MNETPEKRQSRVDEGVATERPEGPGVQRPWTVMLLWLPRDDTSAPAPRPRSPPA